MDFSQINEEDIFQYLQFPDHPGDGFINLNHENHSANCDQATPSFPTEAFSVTSDPSNLHVTDTLESRDELHPMDWGLSVQDESIDVDAVCGQDILGNALMPDVGLTWDRSIAEAADVVIDDFFAAVLADRLIITAVQGSQEPVPATTGHQAYMGGFITGARISDISHLNANSNHPPNIGSVATEPEIYTPRTQGTTLDVSRKRPKITQTAAQRGSVPLLFVQEIPAQSQNTGKRKRKDAVDDEFSDAFRPKQYTFLNDATIPRKLVPRTDEQVLNRKVVQHISCCLLCKISKERCSPGDVCDRCRRIFASYRRSKKRTNCRIPIYRTICVRVNPFKIMTNERTVFFLPTQHLDLAYVIASRFGYDISEYNGNIWDNRVRCSGYLTNRFVRGTTQSFFPGHWDQMPEGLRGAIARENGIRRMIFEFINKIVSNFLLENFALNYWKNLILETLLLSSTRDPGSTNSSPPRKYARGSRIHPSPSPPEPFQVIDGYIRKNIRTDRTKHESYSPCLKFTLQHDYSGVNEAALHLPSGLSYRVVSLDILKESDPLEWKPLINHMLDCMTSHVVLFRRICDEMESLVKNAGSAWDLQRLTLLLDDICSLRRMIRKPRLEKLKPTDSNFLIKMVDTMRLGPDAKKGMELGEFYSNTLRCFQSYVTERILEATPKRRRY